MPGRSPGDAARCELIKCSLLRTCGSFGLGNLLRTIAAQHLVEIGLRLLKRRLCLRPLRLEFVTFETYQGRSSFYDLALFHRNLDNAAADLRSDLDLPRLHSAGVVEARTVGLPRKYQPDGGNNYRRDNSDDDDAALHAIPSDKVESGTRACNTQPTLMLALRCGERFQDIFSMAWLFRAAVRWRTALRGAEDLYYQRRNA